MVISISVDGEVEIDVEHKESDENEKNEKRILDNDDPAGSGSVNDNETRYYSIF